MTDAPELLPCPFCGGEAKIVDAEECGPQAYVVTCDGCMASSRVIFALMDDVTLDLVSAWNARADLHQQALEAAEARGYGQAVDEVEKLCANAFAEHVTMAIYGEADNARNRESAAGMAEKLLHAIRALAQKDEGQ